MTPPSERSSLRPHDQARPWRNLGPAKPTQDALADRQYAGARATHSHALAHGCGRNGARNPRAFWPQDSFLNNPGAGDRFRPVLSATVVGTGARNRALIV